MKRLSTKINVKQSLLLIVSGLIMTTSPLLGQFYASQDGHTLDANNRVGSMGLNTGVAYDSLIPRANLYVTGNITGGARFQGSMPYTSSFEFQGDLGSSTLNTFRRDSSSLNSYSTPQPYVDPSRAVTGSRGNRVGNVMSQWSPTPVGASLLMDRDLSINNLNSGRSKQNSLNANLSGGPSQVPALKSFSTQPRETLFTTKPPVPLTPAMVETEREDRMVNRDEMTSSEQRKVENDKSDYALKPFEESMQMRNEMAVDAEAVSENRMKSDTLGLGNRGLGMASLENKRSRFSAGDPTETSGRTLGNDPDVITEKKTVVLKTLKRSDQLNEKERGELVKLMQQGIDLLSKGRYAQAVDVYSKAFNYASDNGQVCLAKGLSHFGVAEFMTAGYWIDQAFVKEPALALKAIDLKVIYAKQETFKLLTKELDLWESQSSEAELVFIKSYILYCEGQFAEAKNRLMQLMQRKTRLKSVDVLLSAVQKASNK